MSGPLINVYYERKVATERPCYICNRPTVVVLATIKMDDFLYTCPGHLNDPGFATLLSAPPPTPAGPSADDIKKVIADYHARESKKSESKDKKDEDKGKDKDKDGKGKDKEEATKNGGEVPPAAPIPVASPSQTHNKYALHRQIFDMRKMEKQRKDMGVKAKEVSRGLPQVPRGNF